MAADLFPTDHAFKTPIVIDCFPVFAGKMHEDELETGLAVETL